MDQKPRPHPEERLQGASRRMGRRTRRLGQTQRRVVGNDSLVSVLRPPTRPMYDAKYLNGLAFNPVGKNKRRSWHHKLARVWQHSRSSTRRKFSQSLDGVQNPLRRSCRRTRIVLGDESLRMPQMSPRRRRPNQDHLARFALPPFPQRLSSSLISSCGIPLPASISAMDCSI